MIQTRKVAETGRRCPLVRLLPANVGIVDVGEHFLDESEPEFVKQDLWELYTDAMNAGERLEFGRRIRFYRSIRVRQMREEAERKAEARAAEMKGR